TKNHVDLKTNKWDRGLNGRMMTNREQEDIIKHKCQYDGWTCLLMYTTFGIEPKVKVEEKRMETVSFFFFFFFFFFYILLIDV
ncbi:hypothetical protein BLOT_001591, partial [Blomia tropicalis]